MRHRGTVEATSVFLDRSGRRRRLVRMVGVCLGVGLVAVLAVLSAAVFGAGPLHVPGFPDVAGNPPITATPGPGGPADHGRPTSPGGTAGAGGAPSVAAPSTTPTPTSTKPGRVPTQTPPHPTKTK